MVGPTADMDDYSEQVVSIIHMRAVIGGVAQLQLKGEHHPVHKLTHPANTPEPLSASAGYRQVMHVLPKHRDGRALNTPISQLT